MVNSIRTLICIILTASLAVLWLAGCNEPPPPLDLSKVAPSATEAKSGQEIKIDKTRTETESFYGPGGEPIVNKWKVHYIVRKFNYDGKKVSEEGFDLGGKPAEYKKGIHRTTWTYDEQGNKLSEAYFDKAGKPTRNSSGVYERHWKLEWKEKPVEAASDEESETPPGEEP